MLHLQRQQCLAWMEKQPSTSKVSIQLPPLATPLPAPLYPPLPAPLSVSASMAFFPLSVSFCLSLLSSPTSGFCFLFSGYTCVPNHFYLPWYTTFKLLRETLQGLVRHNPEHSCWTEFSPQTRSRSLTYGWCLQINPSLAHLLDKSPVIMLLRRGDSWAAT